MEGLPTLASFVEDSNQHFRLGVFVLRHLYSSSCPRGLFLVVSGATVERFVERKGLDFGVYILKFVLEPFCLQYANKEVQKGFEQKVTLVQLLKYGHGIN